METASVIDGVTFYAHVEQESDRMAGPSKKRTIRRQSVRPAKVPRNVVSVSAKDTIVKMSKWLTTQHVNTAGSNLLRGAQFALNDLDAVSLADIVDRYKMFRLDSVDVYFRMMTNPDAGGLFNTVTQNTNQDLNYFPTLWVADDYTSGAQPGTLQEVKEIAGVKMFVLRHDKFIKYTLRPKPQNEIYRSAISTGYQVDAGKNFILINDRVTPHYGLKYAVEGSANTALNQPMILNTTFKYNFSLRMCA